MTPSNWFTITQVHPQVFAIAEFQHWEEVVSFLLIGQEQAFLIDTGMGYQDIQPVVTHLTDLPVKVLLTHSHWDHIGSAHQFNDVSIFNHPFETAGLEDGFVSADITELVEAKNFNPPFQPKTYHASGTTQYQVLTDGQVVASEPFSIQVIHTPGHTPGSVCYYLPELKLMFTGDTVYPGPLFAQLPESDLAAYAASIKKLAELEPEVALILPGHNAVSAPPTLLSQARSLFQTGEVPTGSRLALLSN